MITFIVRMRFASEDHAEIESILHELAKASRAEPGCVSYNTHFVEDDADTVVIYEQYRDEAALEAHRGMSHFERFAVGGLYQKMKERQIENLTAII
jgi:quinol monooxygenase YgiN